MIEQCTDIAMLFRSKVPRAILLRLTGGHVLSLPADTRYAGKFLMLATVYRLMNALKRAVLDPAYTELAIANDEVAAWINDNTNWASLGFVCSCKF